MTIRDFCWSVFVFVNLSFFMFFNAKLLTGADTQQIMNEGNPLAIALLVIVSLVVSFSRYPR